MPLPDPTHLVSVGHITPGPKRPRVLAAPTTAHANRWLCWLGLRIDVVLGGSSVMRDERGSLVGVAFVDPPTLRLSFVGFGRARRWSTRESE